MLRIKKNRKFKLASLISACTLILSSCVLKEEASNDGKHQAKVSITNDSCKIDVSSLNSGVNKFQLNNNGSQINEFEILAEDKLRIVGERENLVPGTSVSFTLTLEPGAYYTACKLNMMGDYIDLTKLTVNDSGEKIIESKDVQELKSTAINSYKNYIKDQAGQLLTGTQEFVKLYLQNDFENAKKQYPLVRRFYERIEPTAESFGDIDPKLDAREQDINPSELEKTWTGWHAIEKDLWNTIPELKYSPDKSKRLGELLNRDTKNLYDKVYDKNFTIKLDDISNGSIALLEEIALTKVTGEEEAYSHTDLYDFYANVQGAKVAFDLVKKIGEKKDRTLVLKIDNKFLELNTLLDKFKISSDDFKSYETVSKSQKKELTNRVNALRVPLAKLTDLILES